jgi:tetratricopeptide (TPR) repeat protein
MVRLSEARYDESISLLRRALSQDEYASLTRGHLGLAYGCAGRIKDARVQLERLKSISDTRYVSAYSTALVHVGLGHHHLALADLETALEMGEPWLNHARVTPLFDPLRGEPRFTELLREVQPRFDSGTV